MENKISYTDFIQAQKKINEIHEKVFNRIKNISFFASDDDYTESERIEINENEKIINLFKAQNPFKVMIFISGAAEEIGYFSTKEEAIELVDSYVKKGNSGFVVDVSKGCSGNEIYTKWCKE